MRASRPSHLPILITALVLGTAACGTGQDAAFRNAVPSEQSVTVNTPDSGSANALTLGQTSDFYKMTYAVSRDVNSGVRDLVRLIKSIVAKPATTRKTDERIWGPGAADALSPVLYRLVVDREATGKYSYSLQYRPRGSADTDSNYTSIITGDSDVTSGKNDGLGDMSVSIDDWAQVQPNGCGTGTLDIHYDTTTDPETLTVQFNNFSPCAGGSTADGRPLQAATYYYARHPDGSGDFQFTALGDAQNGAYTPVVDETFAMRSRWTATGAGRSDVTISGGDLMQQNGISQVSASECWDGSFSLVYSNMQPSQVDPSRANLGDPSACPDAMQQPDYASDL